MVLQERNMKTNHTLRNTIIIVFVALVVLFPVIKTSAHFFLNKTNPSNELVLTNLAKITDNRASQIIEHLGYTVSYNTDWHIPNWVAYQLTKAETLGKAPRADVFLPDPQAQGIVIGSSDYSNSGYDRGHMAPAADMKWSKQAMMESFYLTNVCPQNHNLNGGDWRDLEERVRLYAQWYGELFIVCGPIVSANAKTIGHNKIVVPDSFYKVLLKKNESSYDAIGFVFRNQAGHKPISSYVLTVDSVEALSGIDFFTFLPDAIESSVEANYSLSAWNLR